jgi:DNA-binding transcriptional regulator YhcF (GntR family)
MSLAELRQWFDVLKRRRKLGEAVPSVTEIANRAGISRQTVYALLRNERTEFGEVAQIRLSRVIFEISASPNFQKSRLMAISLSSGYPRITFVTKL